MNSKVFFFAPLIAGTLALSACNQDNGNELVNGVDNEVVVNEDVDFNSDRVDNKVNEGDEKPL